MANFATGQNPISRQSAPVYSEAVSELLRWICGMLFTTWLSVSLWGVNAWTPYGFVEYSALLIATGLNLDMTGYTGDTPSHGFALTLLRLAIIAGFCVLQALFLFGGGKMRVQPGVVRWYRMTVSVIIFALIMVVICIGFWACYMELANRSLLSEVSSTIVEGTTATWLFWIAIGMIAIRKTDQPTGLSRLVMCLLAGSWIEFAVALPIYLGSRENDCPCASGSWLALILSGPLLLWSIGPGIFLLFLREKMACQSDVRHSKNVLLQKTTRSAKNQKT